MKLSRRTLLRVVLLVYLTLGFSHHTLLFAQNGPGKIRSADGTSSFVLWLRSDLGTSTTADGAYLTDWNDQSGYGHNAIQTSTRRQPLFYNSSYTINSLPVIRFDGDLSDGGAFGDRMIISDTDTLDNTRGLTVFFVSRATTLDGNPRGVLSKRLAVGSEESYSSFFYTSNYLNIELAVNPRQTAGSAYTTSTSFITSFVFDNPYLLSYKNGSSIGALANQTANIPNGTADLYIGQLQGNLTGFFAGDIAEILVYTEGLNIAEKTLIENYLSSRYAINISNDRYAYETSFGTDIYGIGKEFNGSMNSNSSDRFIASISSFSEGTYLMFGHNNSPATFTEESDLPFGNNARLERVWRLDLTGSPATINAKFDVSGLSLSAGETYALLVDSDGIFGSGALEYAGLVENDTLTVPGIVVSSDAYLTLGKMTLTASTTFYSYQNGNWESASSWTKDPSGFVQIPVGGQIPSDYGNVTILNGRTITIPNSDTDPKLTVTLNIETGAKVDISATTGHSFGLVTGQGTFALSAWAFPTGSFIPLRGINGGTIEFKDIGGTLPSGITQYWNLAVTNSTGNTNTVVVDHNITVSNNLDVSNSGFGTLSFKVGATSSPRMLIVKGATHIQNATLTVSSSFATQMIEFHGDLTNTDGVINFMNGFGKANVYFKGADDNNVYLGGTLNQFYFIEVDKGTDHNSILDIDAGLGSNFQVTTVSGPKINIKAGTLKLSSSNIALSDLGNGENYNIGGALNHNGALWLNGATITSPEAWVIYGELTVSSGSLIVSGEGIGIIDGGEIIIEGGEVTVEKYSVALGASTNSGTLTVSGGVLNIDNTLVGAKANGYAAFSIPFATQFFHMSGGTINVLYAESGGTSIGGGIMINADPGNLDIRGGTFNVFIPDGTNDFRIASTAPFYNLTIQKNGVGTGNARLQTINPITPVLAHDLVVINNFTLLSTGNPVFDAQGYNVSVGGNFTVEAGASFINTGNLNTFAIQESFLTDIEDYHSITLNSATTFDNVLFAADSLITFSGSTSPIITGDFTLYEGSFTDNGKNILVRGNMEINGTHIGTGSILAKGATEQFLSGTGTLQNLTVDNVSKVTLASNINLEGELRLKSGLFDAGLFNLNLGQSATVYDSDTGTGTAFTGTKMIQSNGLFSSGGVTKSYSSAGGSFKFPIGVAGIYTPFTANITNADGLAGTIQATPVSSQHPNVSVTGKSLTYFWSVDTTGFGAAASATYTFRYDNSDIVGTEANYVYGDFDNASASWTAGTIFDVNESTNTIGGEGTELAGTTNLAGQFTAGEASAFGSITVFYSRANGNWNNPSTWSNISHTGAAAVSAPSITDFVLVGDGETNNHAIYVLDANSASCSVLKISQNSSLDVRASTGNMFTLALEGALGFGTLRINSATFPGGDWTDFVVAGSGTVEYYTDSSGDFTLPVSQNVYHNLRFVNEDVVPRVITLPAASLTIRGDLYVGSSSNTAPLSVKTNALGAYGLTILKDFVETSVSATNTTSFTFVSGVASSHSISGNVTLDVNSTLKAENLGTAKHTLTTKGNFVINGALDLYTGLTDVNVTFTDTLTQTVTGSGSTVDFANITVNKGIDYLASAQINAPSATISGEITLTNGSLRLTSSSPITLSNNTGFSIPRNTELFLDGIAAQVTGTGFISLSGRLRVDAGTLSVGTTNQNNYIEYSGSGTPELVINGGSVVVASQIRRPIDTSSGSLYFKQTNGTLTVANQQAPTANRGVFEVLNLGQYDVSGGTIIITRAQTGSSDATIAAVYIRPGVESVIGGTLQIGGFNTPASQIIRINSTAEIYNFKVVTTNAPTAKLKSTAINVLNNFTIDETATFLSDGLNVKIGNDFVNAGTYVPVTNSTEFTGASQSITGATTFYDMIYSGLGLISLNDDITVTNNLSIPLTGTIDTEVHILTVKKDITNNGNIISSTGELLLDGSITQKIYGNGNGEFDRINLDNPAGVTLFHNIEIADRLQLTDGNFGIGSFLLTISSLSSNAVVDGALGSLFSTTNMIMLNGSASDNGVTKWFPSGASSFIYPMGTAFGYTPVSYEFTSNSVAGTINVQSIGATVSSRTDNNADGPDLLDHYWEVSTTGFGAFNVIHTYTYLEDDVQNLGASLSDADYFAARFNALIWSFGPAIGSLNSTTNVITIDGGSSGVSYLAGSYTAGAAEEFGLLVTFYSRMDGDWSEPATWSNTNHEGEASLVVPNGKVVFIDAAHTVMVRGNSKLASSVEIQGCLDVGVTTGHNFGKITGHGTMCMGSSIFPGGEFSSFTSKDGGTVELLAGNYTLPTQVTYNNLKIASTGIKTLPNLNITILGDLILEAGVLNASTFNKSINLYGDWINNASSGGFNSGTGNIVLLGTTDQTIGGFFTTTFGNITISNGQSGNKLTGDIILNKTLNLAAGKLDLKGHSISMGTGASLNENNSNYVYSSTGSGSIDMQSRYIASSPGNVAGLGFDIVYTDAALGNTTISRHHEPIAENGLHSISRWYSVSPTNNNALNATVRFRYLDSDIVGHDETSLSLYRKPSGGGWQEVVGVVNVSSNYIQATSVAAFSEWTVDYVGSLPIEIMLTEASYSKHGNMLTWQTFSEHENYGFMVERLCPKNSTIWKEVSFVRGAGNAYEQQDYVFVDPDNQISGIYCYRIRQLDYNGSTTLFYFDDIVVSVPQKNSLGNNYPNPFNPVTTIPFELTVQSYVSISIFDLQGRLVAKVLEADYSPGRYEVIFDASHLSSGTYLVRSLLGNQVFTKKMLLLK